MSPASGATTAPPHPHPRPPDFVLPPRSCDSHCHVFGPASRYPYAAGRPYTPPDAPLAKLQALHARLRSKRAVLVNATPHGRDNRVVTDAIAASAAGPPYHDVVPLARRLIEIDPDRLLWGTDWPHPNVRAMPDDGDLVDLVPVHADDTRVREKLLVDNPARLFGFPR